jgi:hypothetical protein
MPRIVHWCQLALVPNFSFAGKGSSMLQRYLTAGWSLTQLVCAAALVCCLSASLPASAGTVLDMPILSLGFIEYQSCARNPVLLGRGLKVAQMIYGSNALPMLGGRLTFASGSFVGSSSAGWFWGAGGNLAVKGCADLNHDGRCGTVDFKGTLMTGSFVDEKLINLNGKEILEAQIVDQINPQLAALLHLSDPTYKGQLDLMLTSIGGGWVRYAVDSGSLIDCHTVPETSSFLLLGVSLLALGLIVFSPSAVSRLKGLRRTRLT